VERRPLPELTAFEQQVVLLRARGETTRGIAAQLGVTPRTVDWHLVRARRKLERSASLHRLIGDDGVEGPPKEAE
jgi:DNA-binding NarL/FixJ family response regulator